MKYDITIRDLMGGGLNAKNATFKKNLPFYSQKNLRKTKCMVMIIIKPSTLIAGPIRPYTSNENVLNFENLLYSHKYLMMFMKPST